MPGVVTVMPWSTACWLHESEASSPSTVLDHCAVEEELRRSGIRERDICDREVPGAHADRDVPLTRGGSGSCRRPKRSSICVVPRLHAWSRPHPEQRLARLRHGVDVDGSGSHEHPEGPSRLSYGGACWAGRAGVTRRADRPVSACRSGRSGPGRRCRHRRHRLSHLPGRLHRSSPLFRSGQQARPRVSHGAWTRQPGAPICPLAPAAPVAPVAPVSPAGTMEAGKRPFAPSGKSFPARGCFDTPTPPTVFAFPACLAKPAMWPATAGVLLATSATTRATMSVGVRAPVVFSHGRTVGATSAFRYRGIGPSSLARRLV